MSDESLLVTLVYRVRGDVEEITEWASEMGKASREVLAMEAHFSQADSKQVKFLGAFVTKGVR